MHTHSTHPLQPYYIVICRTGFDSCDTILFLFGKHEHEFSICNSVFLFHSLPLALSRSHTLLLPLLFFHHFKHSESNKSGRAHFDFSVVRGWLLAVYFLMTSTLIDSIWTNLIHVFCFIFAFSALFFYLCDTK